MKENRPGITEKLRRVKEYSFRKAPQALLAFGALTFAGSTTGVVIQGSEIFGNHSFKPETPSITRDKKRAEQDTNPRAVAFPFESKNQLTIDEFNQQFDAVFAEARKATPESFVATAIYYTQRGDQIILSKRQAERILLPLPQDPNNSQIPNTFREILINSLDWHQSETQQKFPSYTAKSQTWCVLPEGYKPRLQNSVVVEDAKGAEILMKFTPREIKQEELYKLAKSLTETFNWAVDNKGFYPLQEIPRISPPQFPKSKESDPFIPPKPREDNQRA